MEYDISLIDFKKRTLEISVINKKINNKEKIGSIEIRLYDIEWSNNEYIKWYDLRQFSLDLCINVNDDFIFKFIK